MQEFKGSLWDIGEEEMAAFIREAAKVIQRATAVDILGLRKEKKVPVNKVNHVPNPSIAASVTIPGGFQIRYMPNPSDADITLKASNRLASEETMYALTTVNNYCENKKLKLKLINQPNLKDGREVGLTIQGPAGELFGIETDSLEKAVSAAREWVESDSMSRPT